MTIFFSPCGFSPVTVNCLKNSQLVRAKHRAVSQVTVVFLTSYSRISYFFPQVINWSDRWLDFVAAMILLSFYFKFSIFYYAKYLLYVSCLLICNYLFPNNINSWGCLLMRCISGKLITHVFTPKNMTRSEIRKLWFIYQGLTPEHPQESRWCHMWQTVRNDKGANKHYHVTLRQLCRMEGNALWLYSNFLCKNCLWVIDQLHFIYSH